MIKKIIITITIAITLSFSGFGQMQQTFIPDTTIQGFIFYFHYGYGVPSGDFSKNFYNTNQLGGGFMYKTMSGLNFALESNFVFGEKVKNSDKLMNSIATQQGYIIDHVGMFANVSLMLRGFTVFAKTGMLFEMGKHYNSGIMAQLGVGYMQHKIRIEIPNNNVPQLDGEYKKGYDNLCAGPAIVEYIGYHYQGKNPRLNFLIGIESVQAFTKYQRIYNFNEMKKNSGSRIDILTSIKAGWMLPLYPKTKTKFYYN